MKKSGIKILVGALIVVFIAAGYLWGVVMDYEYPYWPTLWRASWTRIPDGARMDDLVRVRTTNLAVAPHWHHCGWCDVVFPHAQHRAVKVRISEKDFYLFDWDSKRNRLLPITVRTAKIFPELVPRGYIVQPLGVGLNPQLYNNDEPCRIVARVE